MEFLDFIYSIGAGVLGGFIVLSYQIVWDGLKKKKSFWKYILPTVISVLFLLFIIWASKIIMF